KRQGTSGRICSCGAVGVQPPLSGIPRPTIPSSRTALRAETNTVAVTATAFVSLEFANSPITSRLAVSLTRATIGIGRMRLKTTWLQHESVGDVHAGDDDSEGRHHNDEAAQPKRDTEWYKALHDHLAGHDSDDGAGKTGSQQREHK